MTTPAICSNPGDQPSKEEALAQELEQLADDETIPTEKRKRLIEMASELRALAISNDRGRMLSNAIGAGNLIVNIAKLLKDL